MLNKKFDSGLFYILPQRLKQNTTESVRSKGKQIDDVQQKYK